HRRCERMADPIPPRRRRRHGGASGRNLDPDVSRRLAGVQRSSKTDSLTWITGRHILKFGGRIYRRNILFTDARSHNGVFNFTGVMTQNPASAAGTGDAFADWMLGYPANATRSNPATWCVGAGTYWHGFVQDDLKVADS